MLERGRGVLTLFPPPGPSPLYLPPPILWHSLGLFDFDGKFQKNNISNSDDEKQTIAKMMTWFVEKKSSLWPKINKTWLTSKVSKGFVNVQFSTRVYTCFLDCSLITRMHSNRMRTAHLLPVSPIMHCSGGSGGVPARGVCTCPGGGGYLPRYSPTVNRILDTRNWKYCLAPNCGR